MHWGPADFALWKRLATDPGQREVEEKLRAEMQTHGRQSLLKLFDELVKRMHFGEDLAVMKGKKPKTYAEACEELEQCLDSMKTHDERTNDAAVY